jgi:hypothetical protein
MTPTGRAQSGPGASSSGVSDMALAPRPSPWPGHQFAHGCGCTAGRFLFPLPWQRKVARMTHQILVLAGMQSGAGLTPCGIIEAMAGTSWLLRRSGESRRGF